MYQTKTSQIETVRTNDAEMFTNKVNALMIMHREEQPQLDIMTIGNEFAAVIRYEVAERIPQGAADEANMNGEYHQCKECPYLKKPKGGRQRFFPCEQRPHGTSLTANCCDWFYSKLAEDSKSDR